MNIHLYEIQAPGTKVALGFVMAPTPYLASETFKKAADNKNSVLTVKTQENIADVDSSTFESRAIVFDVPGAPVPDALAAKQAEAINKAPKAYVAPAKSTYTPPLPAGTTVTPVPTKAAPALATNPGSPAGSPAGSTGTPAGQETIEVPKDLATKVNGLLRRMSWTAKFDRDIVSDFDDVVFPKIERDFIVTVRGLEHAVEKFSEKGLVGVDLDGKFQGLSMFLEELVLPDEEDQK